MKHANSIWRGGLTLLLLAAALWSGDAFAQAFGKNKVQAKRTATAANALRFLWDYLGWTGGKRPVALGLIGPLHAEFKSYRQAAELMCRRFDARFPYANL